jgi:choline dehydrogenase-like flavoprotein
VAHCTVIGSGPSGIHFALSALARGHRVEMIDVGFTTPEPPRPQSTFSALKHELDDPAAYLLGADRSGVLLPGEHEEFYSIPPAKQYALQPVDGMPLHTTRFQPMASFARGGLAQMWTGGCYPFSAADLSAFPFAPDTLQPYYALIAERIGISGVADDLAECIPLHAGLQEPLRLDRHSARLLERYTRQREQFRQRFGCRVGRARQAVLSRALGSRKACEYLGRCIWGCPNGALYTPAGSLEDCRRFPGFSYHGMIRVTHFSYAADGRVQSVHGVAPDGSNARAFAVENLVLAAGALGSTRLYLESVYRQSGEILRLPGLMDNRQVLVPFFSPGMVGQASEPDSYQYNQLAMTLGGAQPEQDVHCLITTLKTALLHPVIEKLPFDLRTSLYLFRNLHAALGVVNLNFHDTRRDDCYATLDASRDPAQPVLVLHYTPPADEPARIRQTLKRLRKVLWKLGGIVPPGMTHVRPMGASVHYAGTLPMSARAQPHTVSPDCRSHDFPNLYIADGASYPFLPARNITFTLMANAARIADCIE